MNIGGCSVCKLTFINERELLIHIHSHCPNIFYLTADYVSDISVISEEDTKDFVTPEPAASPESPLPLENSPCVELKNAQQLVEENKDPFVRISRILQNISTAALTNRPTMVEFDSSNDIKSFSCSECHLKFDKAESYNDHLNLHIKISDHGNDEVDDYQEFKCIECGNSFPGDVNRYRDHLKIAHGAKTLSCIVCDQQFGTNFELNRHMGAHSGGSYECKACGACFRNKKDLCNHKCHADQLPVDYSKTSDNGKINNANSSSFRQLLNLKNEIDDVICDDQVQFGEDSRTVVKSNSSSSNDYLEQILASTVSHRPTRPKLARCKRKKISTTLKIISPESAKKKISKNSQEISKIPFLVNKDTLVENAEEKTSNSDYFLELFESNVCKYRKRSSHNTGNSVNAFNCYLTKCMDMASSAVAKSPNSSRQN